MSYYNNHHDNYNKIYINGMNRGDRVTGSETWNLEKERARQAKEAEVMTNVSEIPRESSGETCLVRGTNSWGHGRKSDKNIIAII